MHSDFLGRQLGPLVVAIVVIVLGVLPTTGVLRSARPASSRGAETRGASDHRPHRRAAADPLEGLAAALAAGPGESCPPPLVERLRRGIPDGARRAAVLVVVTAGEPWPESEERRRRDRVAIQLAAHASGLTRRDDGRLAFATVIAAKAPATVATGAAVEWFDRGGPGSKTPHAGPDRVAVVWIANSDASEIRLGERLDAIVTAIDAIQGAVRSPVALIGPPYSGDLLELLDEVRPGSPSRVQRVWPDRVVVVSATATASNEALREAMTGDRETASGAGPCDDAIGCSLVRPAPTDDRLLAAIYAELRGRRSLCFRGRPAPVVLLHEIDTIYGRSLADEAKRVFGGGAGAPLFTLHAIPYLRGIDGQQPDRIESGRGAAGSTEQSRAAPNADDLARQLLERAGDDRAVGEARGDYLRRLAREIETRLAGSGPIFAIGLLGTDYYDKLMLLQALRGRFPSAIFFTLELDARMHDPDSRPWTRNLLVASTGGLVPRGEGCETLSFRDDGQRAIFDAARRIFGAPIPPASPRIDGAPSRWPEGTDAWKAGTPRLYEVARRSFVELPGDDGAPVVAWRRALPIVVAAIGILLVLCCGYATSGGSKSRRSRARARGHGTEAPRRARPVLSTWLQFARALRGDRRFERDRSPELAWIAVGALGGLVGVGAVATWLVGGAAASFTYLATCALWCLILLAALLLSIRLAQHAERSDLRPPAPLRRLRDAFGWTILIVSACVGLPVGAAILSGEPLDLLGGTSVVVTDIVRLLASAGAVWASVVFWRRLASTRRRIDEITRFDHPTPRIATLASCSLLVSGPGAIRSGRQTVCRLVADLKRLSTRRAIAVRVLPLSAVWLCALSLLFVVWPSVVPARGTAMIVVDQLCTVLLVATTTLLTFLIWDQIRLCNRFIGMLPGDRPSDYPESATEHVGEAHKLATSLVDLELIAAITDAPRRLLFVPVLLLVVASVARSRLVDNWYLNPALAVALTLSVGLVIHGAAVLRTTARDAREDEIERLDRLRDRSDPEAKPIERMIRRVREFRGGPFEDLFHEPVTQAVAIVLAPLAIGFMARLVSGLGS